MTYVRMSSSQMYQTGLNNMLKAQQSVNKTQEQIAANKRVLTPGDDPIAATRMLQLNQELAQIEQYNKTLSGLENRLQREEVALDGVSDLIFRAQELITQSGNGVLGQQERNAIANELEAVADNMAQFMNARDAGGEYIFAGYQGGSQPFVKDAQGRYRYTGDEGQREVRIGPTTTVPANDSGKHVFMDIASMTPGITAAANPGNQSEARIGSERVLDAEAFGDFYPESVVIEFNPTGDVTPPGPNYSIRQASDGRPLAENVAYRPGEPIEFAGVSVSIDGQPAPGDSFRVESTNKKGLLEGLEQYIGLLRSSTGSSELNEHMNNALGNLDNAQVRLVETRSAVGSRLNVVDNARASNQEFTQVTQEALSEVGDLDYAEAVSRLTQESFVLEAAQASFSRVSRLSLFNYF